jgi:hypothetical protein
MVPLLIAGLALLATGCGSDGDDGGAGSAAAGTATAAQADKSLDQDELLAVHDELYECLRQADIGVLASYAGGKASVGESARQPEFDAELAAPAAESALLDGNKASYVGIRADQRTPGDRAAPDWDVLIFPSDAAAAEALPALQSEAPAEQDGLIVRVVKRNGRGGAAAEAEAALTSCAEQARPG